MENHYWPQVKQLILLWNDNLIKGSDKQLIQASNKGFSFGNWAKICTSSCLKYLHLNLIVLCHFLLFEKIFCLLSVFYFSPCLGVSPIFSECSRRSVGHGHLSTGPEPEERFIVYCELAELPLDSNSDLCISNYWLRNMLGNKTTQ